MISMKILLETSTQQVESGFAEGVCLNLTATTKSQIKNYSPSPTSGGYVSNCDFVFLPFLTESDALRDLT